MFPTKKFWKPVLVVEAPIETDQAELIGALYLWDANGNPVDFEGTHKLHGELSGPEVTLKGLTETMVTKAEKVGRFAIWRAEKKGMMLRVRIHFPETDEARLSELIRMLAQINKDGYDVMVCDEQLPLVPTAVRDDPNFVFPKPGLDGLYDYNVCTKRPFNSKHITAVLEELEVEEGFLCGWHLKITNKDGSEKVDQRFLSDSTPVYKSQVEARERGVAELLHPAEVFAKELGVVKELSKLQDYMYDLVPELAKKRAAEGGQATLEVQ